MSTSGSSNFNQTRNEIILDAFAELGVYGVGRTVSSEDMQYAVNTFNRLIKHRMADGLHLWAKEEAYLFVAENTGQYTLSNDSSSARACLRSDAVITQLNGDHTASDTTLVVDSTSGMTAGDIIGVVEADDGVTWTTIVSVDSSTALTITSGLGSACSDNANVYTFTSRITKPLRILGMRRVTGDPDSPSSIPMMSLSHQEYFDLPSKNSNGNTTHFYYNPDLTTGQLYLWPRPDTPSTYFEITFERMLEDMDSAGDNLDFPSQWQRYFVIALAADMCGAFGKSDRKVELQTSAKEALDDMLSFDVEADSISLMPDTLYR